MRFKRRLEPTALASLFSGLKPPIPRNFIRSILFLGLVSLSGADEFDMLDAIDSTETAQDFKEEKSFVNARLKLSYQYNEESDSTKKFFLNLNKRGTHYQVDMRVIGDEDEVRLNLKELYFKGEISPTNIMEVGRLNVKEGVARGFNPSDFFKGSTSLTLSSDPKDIKDNRLGSVMMQNTIFWNKFTFKGIYSPKISVDEDSFWGSSKKYGLQLDKTNFQTRKSLYLGYSGFKDVSASMILHQNNELEEASFGLNLSYVKENWIFYMESSFKKAKNQITKTIESFNLSPTVQNTFGSSKKNIQKAVVGFNYTYDNISTNFEYIFNSSGLNKSGWEKWFELAKNSPQTAGQLGAIRGDISRKSDTMSHSTLFMFSRMTDIYTNLDASLLLWINPYDASTLSQVGLDYTIKDNFQTGIYVRNYQGGNDTQYGSTLDSYQILIEGEYFF